MNKILKKSNIIHMVAAILLLISSFLMFDFYKCLSGFVANGFREPLSMIPLISSYILPVFSFIFAFYDFYVRGAHKIARITYSCITFVWACANLALVFNKIDLYLSNNALGAYDSLYSIFVKFPFDAIIINTFLAILQILNLFVIFKPTSKIALFKESIKQYGTSKVSIFEYLILSVLAILALAFTGGALGALAAIKNALYDGKYIFLILWELLIPLSNLIFFIFGNFSYNVGKIGKRVLLISQISFNIAAFALLLIFEIASPGFMVQIAKPLFPITFSVSLPIEMIAISAISALSIITCTVRLIFTFKKDK